MTLTAQKMPGEEGGDGGRRKKINYETEERDDFELESDELHWRTTSTKKGTEKQGRCSELYANWSP